MSAITPDMTNTTAQRINSAARRLAETTVSKRTEKRRALAFVRNTIALDPDTPLARKRGAR